MSRPSKEAYDLSDAEKRDLIALIQQGKPLPEKYRFILFEDKREVELVWNGKTRDVCTTILPFQTLEHIDEPRTETKSQEDLFDPRGRQLRGWTNKLIWGDNKLILSSLKSGALRQQIEDAGGLKLIYIDPPFDVGEVITECRKRGAWRVDVLAFEFEMGLFPAALEEARGKGIDLAPKTIPPEVFDKRAVDKGQVQFFDIAYVEATPRHAKGRTAKGKLALAIELTDFSVHYTQGASEAAEATLKDGKSAVVCHDGQLYKLAKSKDGVVTRERLTKVWTDWVDYWAVDFNYMSRKDIIKVQRGMGLEGHLPGVEPLQGELQEFEERWTGGYIFENEWQSFRTHQSRELELTTAEHAYAQPGRYTVPVKVIDIFGNDTMTLVPVSVG